MPILGERSLEDNATAKLLLFEDSGNDLIPSGSGLCGSNMGMHGKTKKAVRVVLPKSNVPLHPGMCDTKYHILKY